ncbi:hypothetical protein E8E11_002218 [Didymella keratinophila]|nr:hypothetical protein E8E11_002218 [Didymella keratinophila]
MAPPSEVSVPAIGLPGQLPPSQPPRLVAAALVSTVKQHRTERNANKGSMRIPSKDIVRKATAASEQALDRRQSEYSATRLESESCMLDAEPRTVLDKVLLDSNSISSPLLRLPPELRNAVYKRFRQEQESLKRQQDTEMAAMRQRHKLQNEEMASNITRYNHENSSPQNSATRSTPTRSSTNDALAAPGLPPTHQETALLAFKLATFRMPAYIPGPLLKGIGRSQAYIIRSLSLELHEGLLYTDDDDDEGKDSPDIKDEIDENELLYIPQGLKWKRDLRHVQFIHDERDNHYFWVWATESQIFTRMRKELQDLRSERRVVVDMNLEEMDEVSRGEWLENILPFV